MGLKENLGRVPQAITLVAFSDLRRLLKQLLKSIVA
jgi:hypothetical protein